MLMEHYPTEFNPDTVALHRSDSCLTNTHTADELGTNRETQSNGIRKNNETRSAQITTPIRPGPTSLLSKRA